MTNSPSVKTRQRKQAKRKHSEQTQGYSVLGSTFTTTFPVALPVRMRSYAFSVSSNAYTESTSGFTFPTLPAGCQRSSTRAHKT